jgi:capsular polysaccharide biosynthesis protein/Mrp family chromosome partitioning ATPase
MEFNGSGSTAGVSDHLGWLLRRWWVVVIAVLLGGSLGFGYALLQPKAYDSMTPVLVLAPEGDGSKVDLDTEAQIVPTAAVASGAQTLLGTSEELTDLIKMVKVSVPANTAILDITFEAPTRSEAQRGSQAFAQAYLDQRNAAAQKQLQLQIANIQDNIDTLTRQLKTVSGQIASDAPNSVSRQQATQEAQILQNQIQQANQRLQPLQGIVIKPGSILSPASFPLHPTKPNVVLYVVSGLALGLLLGLSGALLIGRLDTRIYGASDVPERPGVPVLIEIRPGGSRPQVADAASPQGRDFSLLRNVLRFAAGSSRGGRPAMTDTLLICGAVPGPAAGFVAANVAAAFTRSGERVTIVCTDPASTVPSILGVSARYGLGEVLAGEIEFGAALQPARGIPGVTVMTSGQIDARLELPIVAVSELLQRIQGTTDRVLIAASAPSSAVDAQALSEIAAAVVLVVETRQSHVPQVDTALDQFSQVFAPVAGMVVVDAKWKAGASQPVPLPPVAVRPAVRPVAAEAETTTIMSRPTSKPSAPVTGHATPSAAVPGQTGQSADPSEPRGWRGRTGDATVVFPKVVDVEDPPVEEWAGSPSLDMYSLRDTKRADQP